MNILHAWYFAIALIVFIGVILCIMDEARFVGIVLGCGFVVAAILYALGLITGAYSYAVFGGADCPTAPSRPVAGGKRGSLSDSPFGGGYRPYPPSYVPDPDTPQGDRSPWKDGRRVPGTGQGTDSPRPHTPIGGDGRYVGEPIRVQAGRAER